MRYNSVAKLVIYIQNNRDIKYVPRLALECRQQRKNQKRNGAGNASCMLAYIPNSNKTLIALDYSSKTHQRSPKIVKK